MFLKGFLETAEQHFFSGFNVHVYVFTDQPEEVPKVKMAANRKVGMESTRCAAPATLRCFYFERCRRVY